MPLQLKDWTKRYEKSPRQAFDSLLRGTAAMAPGIDTPQVVEKVAEPDVESPETVHIKTPTRQQLRAAKRGMKKIERMATNRHVRTL